MVAQSSDFLQVVQLLSTFAGLLATPVEKKSGGSKIISTLKFKKLFIKKILESDTQGSQDVMNRRKINTRRLVIRPYRITDYPHWVFAYTQCDPKKSKYDRDPLTPRKCKIETFRILLKKHEKLAKQDHTYQWAIFEKRSGLLIGNIQIFMKCRDRLQIGLLGYRIFNLYWRNGFATEALKAAIPKILLSLKIHQIEAVVDSDNPMSLGLARKIFKHQTIRKNYYYQKRRWDDQFLFSISRSDLRLRVLHPKI